MIEYKYLKTVREVAEYCNEEGILAKDIVQIIPAQGIDGYYLVYQIEVNKENG